MDVERWFFVVLSEAKDLAVVVTLMMTSVNHQLRQSWSGAPQGPSLRSGRRNAPYAIALLVGSVSVRVLAPEAVQASGS
jgi:hypothetical protein